MTEPLLHIGYHKTGSTWLQRRVFDDPSLGFLQAKPRTEIDKAFVVVNPFSYEPDEARARFAPTVEQAGRTGAVPVISHERLSGKQGTNDAQPIAARIHAAYPDAKVLIVIREQRDMLFSSYRAHLVRFGAKRIDQVWRKRTLRERRSAGRSLDYFEYHHLIAYYQRTFGVDRVLVLPYELLRDDPTTFVGRITTFVGLPAPTDIPAIRVNKGMPAGMLAVLRFVNMVMRGIGLTSVFNGPIRDSKLRAARLRIVRALGARFPDRLSRPVERRWKQEIEALVGDGFAKSNRITGELIGVDLAAYGYAVTTDDRTTQTVNP